MKIRLLKVDANKCWSGRVPHQPGAGAVGGRSSLSLSRVHLLSSIIPVLSRKRERERVGVGQHQAERETRMRWDEMDLFLAGPTVRTFYFPLWRHDDADVRGPVPHPFGNCQFTNRIQQHISHQSNILYEEISPTESQCVSSFPPPGKWTWWWWLAGRRSHIRNGHKLV